MELFRLLAELPWMLNGVLQHSKVTGASKRISLRKRNENDLEKIVQIPKTSQKWSARQFIFWITRENN
jgi:hypothetical protein